MREILFRGKRKDNGEWICGDLLQDVESGICAIVSYVNLGGNIHDLSESCIFAVIPETVGQYTGFTDKSGTKIFEGDIVRYGDTIHNVVFEQRNGTAYFGLVYSESETLPFGHYQDLRQIEVIGNIYDNGYPF